MNQDKALPQRHATIRTAGLVLGCAGVLLASSAVLAQGQLRGGGGDGGPASSATDTDRYQAKASPGLIGRAIDYVSNNSYLRIGAIHLQYYGSSTRLQVEDARGLAAQALPAGRSKIEDSGASLGDVTAPGGAFGLYVPGTGHHLATEVILAAPLKTTFEVSKDAVDEAIAPTAINGDNGQPIPTGIPAVGRSIGTLKALPPNFTLVYRPWVDTLIEPYIGAGVAYLYTYDTDITNPVLNNNGNEPRLNLTKPFACIGQLGVDFNLPNRLFFNLDVKYLGCATVKATANDIVLNSPTLSPAFGQVKLGSISTKAHVKAVIYQAAFGIKF